MKKRDINGNTVSKNVKYLISIIKNMQNIEYDIDSVGYFLIKTGDGGHIIFHESEFLGIADMVISKGNKSI